MKDEGGSQITKLSNSSDVDVETEYEELIYPALHLNSSQTLSRLLCKMLKMVRCNCCIILNNIISFGPILILMDCKKSYAF